MKHGKDFIILAWVDYFQKISVITSLKHVKQNDPTHIILVGGTVSSKKSFYKKFLTASWGRLTSFR